MATSQTVAGPGPWIRGAVWALGLGLGVVVALFGNLLSDLRADSVERHGRCLERITDVSQRKQALGQVVDRLAREVAGNSEHIKDHIDRVRKAESRLHALSSNANSRPDPFTGTEGRQLERRIDRLEMTSEKVNLFIGQVGQIKKEFAEVEGFYRRSVLPLIEQSNSLQQQRIQQNRSN